VQPRRFAPITRSMFVSKFDCAAEIEALKAGFQPAGVQSLVNIRLIPHARAQQRTRSTANINDERSIRLEMERRINQRLASSQAA
jgi:hypothetical protein